MLQLTYCRSRQKRLLDRMAQGRLDAVVLAAGIRIENNDLVAPTGVQQLLNSRMDL